MAVLAHSGAAAQDGAHIDHGAFANHGADVDDSTHHDHGVVPDGHAVADGCARLDACVDALHIQQGHCRIAAVVFDVKVLDIVCMGFKNTFELRPVAKDEPAPRPHHRCERSRSRPPCLP